MKEVLDVRVDYSLILVGERTGDLLISIWSILPSRASLWVELRPVVISLQQSTEKLLRYFNNKQVTNMFIQLSFSICMNQKQTFFELQKDKNTELKTSMTVHTAMNTKNYSKIQFY